MKKDQHYLATWIGGLIESSLYHSKLPPEYRYCTRREQAKICNDHFLYMLAGCVDAGSIW